MFAPSFGLRRYVDVDENKTPILQDEDLDNNEDGMDPSPGDEITTTTKESINYSIRDIRFQFNQDLIDTGDLYITTRRFIFIGNCDDIIIY